MFSNDGLSSQREGLIARRIMKLLVALLLVFPSVVGAVDLITYLETQCRGPGKGYSNVPPATCNRFESAKSLFFANTVCQVAAYSNFRCNFIVADGLANACLSYDDGIPSAAWFDNACRRQLLAAASRKSSRKLLAEGDGNWTAAAEAAPSERVQESEGGAGGIWWQWAAGIGSRWRKNLLFPDEGDHGTAQSSSSSKCVELEISAVVYTEDRSRGSWFLRSKNASEMFSELTRVSESQRAKWIQAQGALFQPNVFPRDLNH